MSGDREDMDKRHKIAGEPVSKETVIAALGRPSAEWERNSRRIEHDKHLRYGETALDIAGIRGYAGNDGYLDYLKKSLVDPLGAGTTLVSPEENAAIIAELEPEIKAEIERYTTRLAELERSPDAVEAFINRLKWWREHLYRQEPVDPARETDDVAHDIAARVKQEHDQSLVTLDKEIETYTGLLTELRNGLASS